MSLHPKIILEINAKIGEQYKDGAALADAQNNIYRWFVAHFGGNTSFCDEMVKAEYSKLAQAAEVVSNSRASQPVSQQAVSAFTDAVAESVASGVIVAALEPERAGESQYDEIEDAEIIEAIIEFWDGPAGPAGDTEKFLSERYDFSDEDVRDLIEKARILRLQNLSAPPEPNKFEIDEKLDELIANHRDDKIHPYLATLGIVSDEAADYEERAYSRETSREEAETKFVGDLVDEAKEARADANRLFRELYDKKKRKCEQTTPEEDARFRTIMEEAQQKASTPEIDDTELAPLPVFPNDVFEGTSLWEGLVNPAVANSSKLPEFIAVPAVQCMLNYLSGRVRIKSQDTNLNLFVGLISNPGKFFKSSSCRLAHAFFKKVGTLSERSASMKIAEGKTIVTQAGSSEGFGLSLYRLGAKNAIWFNDELGKLVAKAAIDNAALPSDLLSMYESDSFENGTVDAKKHFNFEAGGYCFGWLWCTTSRGFNRHWPKVAQVVSGLEDRMFYLVAPPEPRPLVMAFDPITDEAAARTNQLIQAAFTRGNYDWQDIVAAQAVFAEFDDPRSQGLLQKFALYFAIDLGLESITADCLERARRLVMYRNQATAYLAPIEADNREARLEQEITRELRQNGGRMQHRELYRSLTANRQGLTFWEMCYKAMIQHHVIVEWWAPGKRGQKLRMVGIPRQPA